MDIALTLGTLWRRKILVALAAIIAIAVAVVNTYAVSLSPPSLDNKNIEYATASTQLLIDSPRSALADTRVDIAPLSRRAEIFGDFLDSAPVRDEIGRQLGAARRPIAVIGGSTGGSTGSEPTADERNQQLVGEGRLQQVVFSTNADSPIINVLAQAPTVDEANALALASARAVVKFVDDLQRRLETPDVSQVDIRVLGQPRSALVNEGANLTVAVLTAAGLFLLLCLVILLVDRLTAELRASRSRETRPVEHASQQSPARGEPDDPVPASRDDPVPASRDDPVPAEPSPR
jgi:capsular polysaccharide biosynthesis protein